MSTASARVTLWCGDLSVKLQDHVRSLITMGSIVDILIVDNLFLVCSGILVFIQHINNSVLYWPISYYSFLFYLYNEGLH